ncbi:hypothetical protein DSCW_28080 [Desulfosarcina widdelii]|uniref:histidine kinase n=1 Tax=Desulfosarcina widdelii TaxID=947919 RepID=A0A5K7Z6S6_9BACT|nr:PAS domain S-box protein [Desulfosarcina widdelii]BBO75391.1 hypothetical protein DSCW_28080 [Desulfosarcina widdelii]
MKSPIPLRRYLSLQFAAVAALPVVIISVLVWFLLMPQMRARNAIENEGLARAVAGQISAHLNGGERQLMGLADFLLRNTPPAALTTGLLDAQCGRGDFFETIYIVSNPDTVIRSVGLARSRRFSHDDLLGMDLTGLDFLADPRIRTASTWSQTFLSTVSSRLAVALIVPLAREVMVGEITLNRLSEFISHLPVESGLLTLVLDRQGRIVADSQRLRWGQQLDLSGLPTTRRDGQAVNASSSFNLDGQSYLGTVVDVQELGWKVLVAQPTTLAFKPIRDAFILIALGLGVALVLALAVAWLQAGGLSKMFRLYAEQSRRIADGEYGLTWPESKTVEFRNLADNLDHMAIMVQQREKQLRENEARLLITQFSIDRAAIGIYRLGPDARIQEVNESAARMIGYTREELSSMTVFDIDPALNKENWGTAWQRLQVQGSDIFETVHHGKDGRRIPVEIYSNLLEYGGRKYAIVFAKDSTERKKSEEELRRLRNYLSNIIDSMPSILVAVDRDGKVTQWNRKAEQETEIDRDTAQAQPLAEVFPRLVREMDCIKTSIRERRVIRDPKVSSRHRDETRYEDVTIFPLVTNGVEGAVIRVDDVTERVRLEEMIIQNEKMLSVGGLAAGMAHEINNPLAGILQNASVLSNRLTGDLPANHEAAEASGTTMTAIRQYLELRKLPDMLENIRRSGSLAATIVKNMLSFARKGDSIVSSHDLCSLLDQSLDLLKTDYDMKKHYDFKKIEIVREYEDAASPVPCEASKIQQVFINILKNGAEAMAERGGGAVPPAFCLRVRDDGQWVRVEIEDNGPGMDEVTCRRIFEPFFTTKPVGKGTGLGLSVSYFIVTEGHGGKMGAYAAEGGGTRFVIRMPKAGKTQ